jgi:glycosyltransferase involved in cell wall biosynthesis
LIVGLRVVEVYEGEIGYDAPLLVRELVRLGFDVGVVCPPRSAEAFAETGAELTRLTVGTGVGSLAALRRVLRADVVHAHGMRAAVAASLARAGATPIVVSLTEAPPAGGAGALVSRAITRTVFSVAAAVLAPTPDLVATATALGGREVRLVRPPVPDPATVERTPEQVREELALHSDGPIVLAASRLQPETRLDVLVDASARWRRRDPEPQVVLVGVGPAYRTLVAQAMVARAPVTFAGDRVDGAATVPPASGDADGEQPATDGREERASLADLLGAAAVVVVTDPRARPGLPLAAARAGVPVVVPQGGVVAGLLGDVTVAVPPGDAESLDAAVRGLLEGDDRAALAAAARQRIADWPDAAAVAGWLAALYEQVSLTTAADVVDTPD